MVLDITLNIYFFIWLILVSMTFRDKFYTFLIILSAGNNSDLKKWKKFIRRGAREKLVTGWRSWLTNNHTLKNRYQDLGYCRLAIATYKNIDVLGSYNLCPRKEGRTHIALYIYRLNLFRCDSISWFGVRKSLREFE